MSKGFDASSGKEIAKAINDKITLVANEAYMNAPYNKTKYGKVISSNAGVFTVEIDREQYPSILSLRNVGEIKRNDVVIVCIPNNNMSNAYIVGVADGTLNAGGGGGGDYVPITRTINGIPLNSDIVLTANNILNSEQLGAVNSGITENLTTQISQNQSSISTINGKIPTQASTSNQLADKNFVNSSINNVAAYYITKDSYGNPFQTRAQLNSATTFYSGGVVRVPTRNDYTIVLADESRATTVGTYPAFTTTSQYIGYYVLYNNTTTLVTSSNKDSVGIVPGTTIAYIDIPTTRYIYDSAFEYQYTVNNSGLTAVQLAALNSGITSSLVTQIGTNQTAIGTLNTGKANLTGGNTFTGTQSITGDGQIMQIWSTTGTGAAQWLPQMVVANKGGGSGSVGFIMGNYRGLAGLGGHTFNTSGTATAWADMYIQPDGPNSVYIGGYNWTANSGVLKITNSNSDTPGKAYVNKGTISTPDFKEVATTSSNITGSSYGVADLGDRNATIGIQWSGNWVATDAGGIPVFQSDGNLRPMQWATVKTKLDIPEISLSGNVLTIRV